MPITDPTKRAEYMRAYRAANHDRIRERDRKAERLYYEAHKPEIQARQRAHRAKNIEHYREYNARWHRENRANNPQKVRAMHLKSNYGISDLEYSQMLVEQDGHCAVCSRVATDEKHGVLNVDHDHSTGGTRGLLCSNCNTALGLANDSQDRLQAMIEYLKRWSSS